MSVTYSAISLTPLQRKVRRHSRLVRALRLLLPLIGIGMIVALIGSLVIGNYLALLRFGDFSMTRDGLVMENPELSGSDGARFYRITARRAIQRIATPHLIDLENIAGIVQPEPGRNVEIAATYGLLDNDAQTLVLQDGIEIVWDGENRARLSDAEIDLEAGILSSNAPVEIRTQDGRLMADRLKIDENRGVYEFRGRVKLILDSNKE